MKSVEKRELFAEVFGYPVENISDEAVQARSVGICPFLDGPCQKSTYVDRQGIRRPMGVCSMFHHGEKIAITCPHRLKSEGLIFDAAMDFCFPGVSSDELVALPEVRLPTKRGRAGNLDYTIVRHKAGRVLDFAGMELQTVYFSGEGMREIFIRYLERQNLGSEFSPQQTGRQNPDYRSSSKKRLLPQLIEKGPIFGAWNKKFVVAIHSDFYEHLINNVSLVEVSKTDADFAWITVDYETTLKNNSRHLAVQRVIPTRFDLVLKAFLLTAEDVPPIQDFVAHLERLVARAVEQRMHQDKG